jgi:hypothetical protein
MLLLAFGLAMLIGGTALAGEVKFGAKPLAVDAKGKITDAGRKAAVTTLENVPGEDRWMLHVWAKLDRPAPGPLYVEFFGNYKGKRYEVWHHEEKDFEGKTYVSLGFELEGRHGFNKNSEYEVEITQLNQAGKNVKLAKGKLKLVKVASKKKEKAEEEERDEEAEEEEEDEGDVDFGGGGGVYGGLEGGDEMPPPLVEPPVERCSVHPNASFPLATFLLLVIGHGVARRRRF